MWCYNKSIKGLRPTQKGPLAGCVVIMTKKEQALYEQYLQSTNYFLDDVYKKPSFEKKRAFWHIFDYDITVYHGFDFRVCSANTFGFSMACKYVTNDNKLRLRYHTRDNVYDFEIGNAE